MSNPRISYTPRPDATPEGEITTLANIYSFVIRCVEDRKRAAVGLPLTSDPLVQGKKANTEEVSNVEL